MKILFPYHLWGQRIETEPLEVEAETLIKALELLCAVPTSYYKGRSVHRLDFRGMTLIGGPNMANCIQSYLAGANFAGCLLKNIDFFRSKWGQGTSFEGATLQNLNFDLSDLRGCSFKETTINDCSFNIKGWKYDRKYVLGAEIIERNMKKYSVQV